jgi:hypothetical protein
MKASHYKGCFVRISPLWALIALLAGCSDSSDANPGSCPQTFEFGNFGCARVEGVVRDASGAPLAKARVGLTPAEGVPNTFNSPSDETDAAGNYSLEIHDLGGEGEHPAPDPVPMNLRAALLTGESFAPTSDLVPVSLKFSAVGEVPEVAMVDITIPVTP